MNVFVLFCQLVLVCVSYSPYVRGGQPDQIYNLEVALKKIYRRIDPYDLQSTERYGRLTHNAQLRFNGGISYTILTDRNQMVDFMMKHIFIALRDIIGVIAFPSNVNVLLKFSNEDHAREVCVQRYGLVDYSESDFKVDKVLAVTNVLNDVIQLEEILRDGAINITKLEPTLMFARDDDYYRFTMYPTGNGPRPAVAMFAADRVNAQLGPKSNFLVLELEVANGAVYFGFIFPSESDATRFFAALHVINVKEGIGYSRMMLEFSNKLADHI